MSTDYNNYDINNFEKDYEETIKLVKYINENSNLGLTFLAVLQDYSPKDIKPDTAIIERTSDDEVYGEGGLFPHNSSDVKLVYMKLKTSNYSLLGIKVGDDINFANKTMDKLGFIVTYDGPYSYRKEDANKFSKTYTKNFLVIYYHYYNEKIEAINIGVKDPTYIPPKKNEVY